MATKEIAAQVRAPGCKTDSDAIASYSKGTCTGSVATSDNATGRADNAIHDKNRRKGDTRVLAG